MFQEYRTPGNQLDKDRGTLAATGFHLTRQHSGNLHCVQEQTYAHRSEFPHRHMAVSCEHV